MYVSMRLHSYMVGFYGAGKSWMYWSVTVVEKGDGWSRYHVTVTVSPRVMRVADALRARHAPLRFLYDYDDFSNPEGYP
jgi:hypothetical protein